MDDQNKNLILATALSFIVILVWFVLFPPEQTQTTDPQTTVEETLPATRAGDATVSSTPGADGQSTAPAAASTAATDAPRIAIESDRLTGSLTLAGGTLDTLQLKEYRTTLDQDADIVTLLRPSGTQDAYYALFGWTPSVGVEADQVPGPDTLWSVADGATLTPDSPVTLTWDNGAGLLFKRTLRLDDKYLFTIEQSVENTGTSEVALLPYAILRRHGEPSDLKNFFILHEGLVRMSDGALQETQYDDLQKLDVDPRERAQADRVDVAENGWIGFTDHYWMTSLAPKPGTAFRSTAKYFANADIFQAETVMPMVTLAPGAQAKTETMLFAGPKEWETIRGYQNNLGISGFLDSIDWGWFFFLTKPMFAALHWLKGLLGNMGWAIIALTFVIKAIVFPLAYRSYASMARMKELQPEIEQLKERVGDDRQKMQQEMMELYKKKKVNPASGCLPMLLQIPIFFSIYKVIFVTIELRHAPWIGWIRDLSAPDPSSILNLFGLLPWSTPEPGSLFFILSLGFLPIVLGISMWLQQKLNPAPTDPTQAAIFAWMPWVFMFMLGGFASGLVIYWITNNVITFVQQYLIMRAHGYHPDVFGNIRQSFRRKKKAE